MREKKTSLNALDMIEMYQKGRISLSSAAELMDTSTFEILRLAKQLKIRSGDTEEQQKKSRKTAKNLVLYIQIALIRNIGDRGPGWGYYR